MRHPIRGDWDAIHGDLDALFQGDHVQRHPRDDCFECRHLKLAKGLSDGERRLRKYAFIIAALKLIVLAAIILCLLALMGPIKIDFLRALK